MLVYLFKLEVEYLIGVGMFFFFKQKTAYEIGVRLVGSEMCIRDRYRRVPLRQSCSAEWHIIGNQQGKEGEYTFDVHEETWKIGRERKENDNRINIGRNIYSDYAEKCM